MRVVAGCKVRLRHDVRTNGGTRFRAGVVMDVDGTDRAFYLRLRVRGTWHHLTLKKRDTYLFDVVSYPEE